MPFIPPMLATCLEDPRRLADPRYSVEPKLDGQRAVRPVGVRHPLAPGGARGRPRLAYAPGHPSWRPVGAVRLRSGRVITTLKDELATIARLPLKALARERTPSPPGYATPPTPRPRRR